MKILTVLGARPQFIKAATVSRAIREHPDVTEVIVHTGQHFDAKMSDVFFEQLDIPRPDYNLGIASLGHGAMTGRMCEALEKVIIKEKPDWVQVYGDTNSTLAGALAGAKLHVPIAHVEAGLRSYNPDMPEEINRILTDRISALLLCPTETAVRNLKQEGFPFTAPTGDTGKTTQRIENVGDVMYDAVLHYRDKALGTVSLDDFELEDKRYALCTLHRQENTDDPKRLTAIFSALRTIAEQTPVLLPLHPRTRSKLEGSNIDLEEIRILDPLPYLEMQRLLIGAKTLLTDSGGMQKEAYFHQVPCITLRDETEWVETVECGANFLAGANSDKILEIFQNPRPLSNESALVYGDGSASSKVVHFLFEAA